MSMPHSEVKECENHQSWRDLIIGGAVMYAIIATGGKQYKVSEGDVIKVEKLDAEVGAKVTFDNVLLVGGDTVKVGTPTVDGAKVEASVVSEGKGKKVIPLAPIPVSLARPESVNKKSQYFAYSFARSTASGPSTKIACINLIPGHSFLRRSANS